MATLPDMFDATSSGDPTAWLKSAQAAVRAYCGWHVCPSITRTVTLDSYGGRTLLLPTMHVTALSSVKFGGVEHVSDCSWSKAGILRLHNGLEFPDDLQAVTVSMTDGFDKSEIPQIGALLKSLAQRAQIQPGVASQSVNGASVTYSTSSTPGVTLLASEKELLEPYRLRGDV